MCADRSSKTARRAAQRGLSIIEVMVGMVVSLLVGLAAVGSAAMFTASQRQGIGTGGAMVNSTTALNAIRDDVAAVGLGFFGDSKYLCNTLNLSVGATKLFDGTAFTPLQVTAETRGDRVDVIYATQVAGGANVLLNTPSTGATAELRSLLPTSTTTGSNAVLLAPPVAGVPCTVRSVTANVAPTVFTRQQLTFANTGTHNQATFTTAPTYVVGDAADNKARIAQLGSLRWARYRLEGTDLRLERPLTSESAVVLARNVVAFRIQYGMAAAGGTTLQGWESPSGSYAALTPTTLTRVKALRISAITRSAQPAKPDADGVCRTTTALPQIFGNPITADVTDWSCYRYRTVTAVVPLRNLVY